MSAPAVGARARARVAGVARADSREAAAAGADARVPRVARGHAGVAAEALTLTTGAALRVVGDAAVIFGAVLSVSGAVAAGVAEAGSTGVDGTGTSDVS